MSAPRQITAIAAVAYLVGLALGGAYFAGHSAQACPGDIAAAAPLHWGRS